MQFFIEVESLEELSDGLSRGLVAGVVVRGMNGEERIRGSIERIRQAGLSLPVLVDPAPEAAVAEDLVERLKHRDIYFVAEGDWDGLSLIHDFHRRRLRVAARCRSVGQALLAARAGAAILLISPADAESVRTASDTIRRSGLEAVVIAESPTTGMVGALGKAGASGFLGTMSVLKEMSGERPMVRG